jgi:hypothetical protein
MVRMDFQIRPLRVGLSFRAKSRNPVAVRCGSDTTFFSFATFARMTAHVQQKTRIEMFNPGFSNLTPPMPFRRITRSLSVTGG